MANFTNIIQSNVSRQLIWTNQTSNATISSSSITSTDFSGLIMCGALAVTSLSNVIGNSLLLVVFLTTASLRTKTDRILTSLVVSDLLTGLTTWLTIASLIASQVMADPCSSFWVATVLPPLGRIGPVTVAWHMIAIAVERYVAVCHPLQYEQKITESVVSILIAAAWMAGILMSLSFYVWLVNYPAAHCGEIFPLRFYFIDTALVVTVLIILVCSYGRLTLIAWHHHIRIHNQSATGSNSAAEAVPVSVTESRSRGSGNAIEIVAIRHTAIISVPATSVYRDKQPNKIVHQFKAVRLTSVIVGLYSVTMIPYHTVNAIRSAGVWSTSVEQALNIVAGVAMLYYGFNWIIYGMASTTIRKALINLMRFRRVGAH